jgi:hypothetical protein
VQHMNQTDKVSLDQVKTVMNKVLLPIPLLWIVVISAGIVISLFEITKTAGGSYSVSSRLTLVTVLLLALVWVPFLLKVLALSGGGLNVLGSEASFEGFGDFLSRFSPEVEREVLPSVLAAIRLTEATSTVSDRKKLQKLREDLEEQFGAVLERVWQGLGLASEDLQSALVGTAINRQAFFRGGFLRFWKHTWRRESYR